MTSEVAILVADDHPLIREGIKAQLEKRPGWTICAEAGNGREAVKLAEKFKPRIAIIDIGMPELNGIDTAIQIHKLSPETAILILTLQESESLIRKSLAAGALGYILKSDAPRLLVGAIESLLKGQPFFTGKVSQVVLSGYLNPEEASQLKSETKPLLSQREREVLQLLAEAKSSKEIATQLGVSLNTIDAHRANIMRKLNLHSVAELVRYSIRNNIINP